MPESPNWTLAEQSLLFSLQVMPAVEHLRLGTAY